MQLAFHILCGICFIYTVADLGVQGYLVRKHGVQEMGRRVRDLFAA